MEQKIEKCLNQLESNDPVQIRLALKKLGNLKVKSALPKIKKFLNHNDRMVIFFAKTAIKKIENSCRINNNIQNKNINTENASSEYASEVVVADPNKIDSSVVATDDFVTKSIPQNSGESIVENVRGQLDLEDFSTTEINNVEKEETDITELHQEDSWLYNSPLNELDSPEDSSGDFNSKSDFSESQHESISFENILEESGSNDTNLFPEDDPAVNSGYDEDENLTIDEEASLNNNPFEDLLNSSWNESDDISVDTEELTTISDSVQGFEILSADNDADFFKNLDKFDVSIETEQDISEPLVNSDKAIENSDNSFESDRIEVDSEELCVDELQDTGVNTEIDDDQKGSDDLEGANNDMFGIPSTGPFADMTDTRNIDVSSEDNIAKDDPLVAENGMPDWWQPQDEESDYGGKPYSPSFGKKRKK